MNDHLKQRYRKRARHLRDMGYESYADYLDSPEWKALRTRFLRRADWKCEVCGKRATQVHHRAYDPGSLQGQTWSLVALCRDCHRYAEFDETGRKMTTNRANRRLAERAKEFNRKLLSSCGNRGCNNHRSHGQAMCSACEADPGRTWGTIIRRQRYLEKKDYREVWGRWPRRQVTKEQERALHSPPPSQP